jgi:parallel beta-helix repeat protein
MKSKKAFVALRYMILVLFFGVALTSGPALAGDYTVCSSGCDHDNIQGAIDDAFDDDPSGGTVTVTDSSIYNTSIVGPITMRDGVNLICSHIDKAHITRSSASGKVEVVRFSGEITCDLKGFKISNSGGGAGIFMDGSSGTVTATVENCDIQLCKGATGIRLNGVVSTTIRGCSIHHNDFAGIATKRGTDELQSGSSVFIEDCEIYQNGTKKDTAGIFLQGANDNNAEVVIRGTGTSGDKTSDIYENARAGIWLDDIDDATIDNNEIRDNSEAGIRLMDVGSESAPATIQYNKIHQNTKSGIAIFKACTVIITDNEIYDHAGEAGIFTGDWSTTYPPQGAGFDRTNGPAILTIKRNKVYGNRAGMRLDHASASSAVAGSGQINNNLVYGNSRAGIRFSGNSIDSTPFPSAVGTWGFAEIINNTVADNGSYVLAFTEDRGGGIIYDDINVTTKPPEYTATRYFYDRPVGSTQDPLSIKNNIVANNKMTGIKYCADNSANDRSYNLYYRNVEGTCDTGGAVDCGKMCRCKTLGQCYEPGINCCEEDSWAYYYSSPVVGHWAEGEICGQDPLFEDGNNETLSLRDYTLQGDSPAIGAGSGGINMGHTGVPTP